MAGVTGRASAMQLPLLPTVATMPAGSANSLVESIGINVHFNYYGSIYTNNAPLMISSLQKLGIQHLRDSMCWQGAQSYNTYYKLHQQLGSLGFKTDYITSISQPMSQVAAYPALVTDMEAVEPANEYDVSGNTNWAAAVAAEQAAIYNTIHGTAGVAGVTVLAPSMAFPGDAAKLGNLGAYADAGDLHGYFSAYNPGSPTNNNPTKYLAVVQPVTPSKPIWVTETGYFAAPGYIFGMYGVTPAVQAIYTQRSLLEYWNAGAARTYLYELADDWISGQNAADYHWGLLDSSGNAKPAFTALANMVSLLRDPGVAFLPAPLALSLKSSATSVHTTLLGKRDGSYELAVWNEVSSYDMINEVELTPATQSVTLTFGKLPVEVLSQQFDTTGNFASKVNLPGLTVTLPVTDILQIVTLRFQ